MTEPTNDAPVDTPPATPAAVAHADATGVDLTQVEGTGVGGTIIKADVVAAAPVAEPEPTPTPEPVAEPPGVEPPAAVTEPQTGAVLTPVDAPAKSAATVNTDWLAAWLKTALAPSVEAQALILQLAEAIKAHLPDFDHDDFIAKGTP
jgi:pyruvate/2-oxoglutarate dehydrogenase complex dihydrolipoamide acyltransferase (E2) component